MASIRGRGFTTKQLKSRYRKKIEIYLEGVDDLGIYQNIWFGHLTDRIMFRLAEDGAIPVSGCSGVEKNVVAQRLAGVEAYGIVDRDAVAAWAISCDPDDTRFVAVNFESNPYLYYTIRWELENYLVDPEFWERERIDSAAMRGGGRRSEEEVARELLTHCDILIAHAAANALRMEQRKKKLGDGIGAEAKTRKEFEEILFSGPMKNLTEEEKASYIEWVKRIEAFDYPGEVEMRRLFGLCRRIHGKALLQRFHRAHNIAGDMRFRVARLMAGRIPEEIAAKVYTWVG